MLPTHDLARLVVMLAVLGAGVAYIGVLVAVVVLLVTRGPTRTTKILTFVLVTATLPIASFRAD